MEEQKIAYIPILAPDAFTTLPEGKPLSGEMSGALPLMRSMDKSIREMKDDFHSFKKETNSAIAELRQDVSTIKEDIGGIKSDVRVMNERIDKNLAQYEAIASEMRGDIKAINARLDTQQTKFGWYLTLFGLVITVVVAAIQLWK